jgi:type IV pilus assembly protein PilC
MHTSSVKKHIYHWSGFSAEGKKTTGEIQAMSLNVARIYLKQQGIKPLRIRKKTLFYKLNSTNQTITAQEITLFFRQLATLIIAGIPILQSCEILRQTQEKLSFRSIIATLKNEITAGRYLVSGLRKFPHYFDEITCHLIHIGEQTGTLETMLNRLALYKEKSIVLRKQIKQAMFYPAMVLITAFIVTIIMLTLVVPRFEELFQSMHGQLPLFTQYIIYLSHFIRHNMWLSLIPVIGFLIGSYYLKTSVKFKQYMDHVLLKIPFIHPVIKKIILARFARNFTTLFSAGIPLIEALKIIAPICGNFVYTKAINELHVNISTGRQLHIAMQINPLFPVLVTQMIKIGEESGKLELMLTKIADLYEADIDHLVINLSHLLEPLIMIVLGVLIGGLVIAMYLPIFKLGTIV